MGLQDRDYYHEKHKGAHQSPRPLIRKSGKTSAGIKYLLYLIITIATILYGVDTLMDKINEITLIRRQLVDRKEKPVELVSGGVNTENEQGGMAHGVSNVFGKFGAGVGAGLTNTIALQQPSWITINPKSKKECFAESGKVLNAIYMRCRNGRQEFVRFDATGKKIVLNERPIPMH